MERRCGGRRNDRRFRIFAQSYPQGFLDRMKTEIPSLIKARHLVDALKIYFFFCYRSFEIHDIFKVLAEVKYKRTVINEKRTNFATRGPRSRILPCFVIDSL